MPRLTKMMKETARLEGIEAYTFYIRLYALKGLYFGVKFCVQRNLDLGKMLQPEYLADARFQH